MSLENKKLIILGGNYETAVLVEKANTLGIYTIVIDPNPHAPSKTFACESYNIDGFDIPKIVEVAKKIKVDGVLVGVADILVSSYQRICQELNLPCYASEKIADAFCSKDGFKKACKEFGVKDIPGFYVSQIEQLKEIVNISYPVMVKPVDNGAGVGMRVCDSEFELNSCVQTSLSYSKKGGVLVEQYMDCDDIFAYYTFKDGEIFLSAIADRITTKKQGQFSPVCIGALYPSKYAKFFYENVHPTLLPMFKGLKIMNGVLNIQFFVKDDIFYAYDPGFRLQGEAPHIPLKEINGFDHREMLLNFSLTGSMGVNDFENRNDFLFKGKKACTLWVLLKGGEIHLLEGLDLIKNDPSVVFIQQRLKKGDVISSEMVGSERQVLARIYIVTNTYKGLAEKVKLFRSYLKIADLDGEDMIVDWLDIDLINAKQIDSL